MTRLKSLLVAPLAALALTGAEASAKAYEQTELLSADAWDVNLTVDTEEDSLWCDASTRNPMRQTLTFAAYEDRSLAMVVIDRRWRLPKAGVEFTMGVDGATWTMRAEARGGAVFARLTESRSATGLLAAMAAGEVLEMKTPEGRTLALFSLKGMDSALTTLADCWDRIAVTYAGPKTPT